MSFHPSTIISSITPGPIIIQHYSSGGSSEQSQSYNDAENFFQAHSKLRYTFNRKRVREIVNADWTMDEFFDWLSAGNATIINCHPLQGEFPPDWDYFEFIQRLEEQCKDKVVFPPLKHGVDCVFTQDKFAYLEKCSDICNPSYKIECEWQKSSPRFDKSWRPLLTENVKAEILAFASNHYEIGNNFEIAGWVVKAPFTTGSRSTRYCKNVSEIFAKALALFRKEEFLGRMPYLILQPRMINPKEVKVAWVTNPHTCCQRGPFIVVNDREKGHKYASDDEILNFAKYARKVYEERFPESLTYPVFRIDIFRTQSGRFVVNEFESLEANIHISISGVNPHLSVIKDFWIDELKIFEKRILEKMMLLTIN